MPKQIGSTANPLIHEYVDYWNMRGNMTEKRKWRIYYNSQAAPLVCSIDNGHPSSEFAVQRAILRNVEFVITRTPEQAKLDRQMNEQLCHSPIEVAFWIEFDATMTIDHGTAYFDGKERPIEPNPR